MSGALLRQLDDEHLLRALFDLSDEATRLQQRAAELAIALDRVAGVIGEKWARAALQAIEEEERHEAAAGCRR